MTFFLSIDNDQKVQIASLLVNKAPITVLTEFSEFADVFYLESDIELPKYMSINDHTIDLVKSQQPSYKPIYNLGPVKLETLKINIKINLANNFICCSKFPIDAPILFV